MKYEFADKLPGRLRQATSLAWTVFAEQVGRGRLLINKEASMQLHYSHILHGLLPMFLNRPNERAHIELETGVKIDGHNREIDLVLCGECGSGSTYTIAVEMKCYRRLASSGKPRGAQDIFRKDVYEDLSLLEKYRQQGQADYGVALIMTDYVGLVFPKSKKAKTHLYDISHGAQFDGIELRVPVGGKDVHIELHGSYAFNWQHIENHYFLKTEDLRPEVSTSM